MIISIHLSFPGPKLGALIPTIIAHKIQLIFDILFIHNKQEVGVICFSHSIGALYGTIYHFNNQTSLSV